MHATKQRLIDEGLRMLLQQGYNSLGLQGLLDLVGVPKGSSYHHFSDKQDFALQVIDAYIAGVHATLDACVTDASLAPLDRIRAFFQHVERSYHQDGYLGCLMGGLGQELSGVSETFRAKIDWCFSSIAKNYNSVLMLLRQKASFRKDAIRP